MVRRWLRDHLLWLCHKTGHPLDEALGRPDMLVAIKNQGGTPGGGSRVYGGDRTIHGTRHLSVETHHGTVVAVWFRCQQLPFRQHEVDGPRAAEMGAVDPDELPRLESVEVTD